MRAVGHGFVISARPVQGGLTLAAVCCLLATGCGSGGPSGTGGTGPYRAAVGQSWQYHATGKATTGGTTADVSGDITVRLLSGNVPGATFANVETGSLAGGGITSPVSNILEEAVDADGKVSVIAIVNAFTGTTSFLTAPVYTQPSTLAAGSTLSNQSTTTDTGAVFSVSQTVVDEETVTVPAGTFDTWKIQGTTVQGDTTSQNTVWFAPTIGAAVQIVSSSSNGSATTNLTYHMTSTNVAH